MDELFVTEHPVFVQISVLNNSLYVLIGDSGVQCPKYVLDISSRDVADVLAVKHLVELLDFVLNCSLEHLPGNPVCELRELYIGVVVHKDSVAVFPILLLTDRQIEVLENLDVFLYHPIGTSSRSWPFLLLFELNSSLSSSMMSSVRDRLTWLNSLALALLNSILVLFGSSTIYKNQ